MTDDNGNKEIHDALAAIGFSAVLILGATIVSQGLGFLTRIVMARYLPVDGYGNVVIGISILNLLGIVTLAGLPQALSRYIPRKDTNQEERRVITSSFHIVVVFSLVISVLLFIFAGDVASIVFGTVDIRWIIRTFSLVLPFYAVFKLSLGGFRGYETTYPNILTDKILLPGVQLIGIVIFVSLGYDTEGIAVAYGFAFILVGVLGGLLLRRIGKISLQDVLVVQELSIYKQLLGFSLPLAASGAMTIIAKHSDIIILGIFKTSGPVGIYEATFRLSMLVVFSITPAVGFLFQPMISRYHARENTKMMERMYSMTMRWILIGTFPIFCLFFLFSEQALGAFFGPKYMSGDIALMILVFGFMVAQTFGLTGNFLTSVGETQYHMYISGLTMIINVVLNILLIPLYGIVGAAIATASAQIVNNGSQMYIIYRYFGIHPFQRNNVIPGILTLTAFILLIFSPIQFTAYNIWGGLLFTSGLALLFPILVLLSRSLYPMEAQLAEDLFEKFGISIPFSKYLSPFIR